MYRFSEPREWIPYIRDMLKAAETVREYVGSLTLDELRADRMRFDAAVRQISIIGEAANRIPTAVRDELATIPWDEIRGMRNRLVHNYEDVIANVVWTTATESVPTLIPALQDIAADPGEA